MGKLFTDDELRKLVKDLKKYYLAHHSEDKGGLTYKKLAELVGMGSPSAINRWFLNGGLPGGPSAQLIKQFLKLHASETTTDCEPNDESHIKPGK